MKALFNYLIFPGFIFSACVGLLAGWVDRKVTARIQWRVGPPWWQNFADIVKLFGKETILPQGAGAMFLLAPYLGLLAALFASTILSLSVRAPSESFSGDLIVILYILVIPALSMVIAASSSANPLASVGASREMKLVLGYELPFILSVIAIVIKSAGAIQIGSIISHQALYGSNLFTLSGVPAFIAVIFCMQAKLCFVPFDMSEAEQEIASGTLIEYSGVPLAVFRITRAIMLYSMPLFVIILFLGKDLSPLFITGKYLMLLVVAILIKNTNPRLRIDQALRFFWGPITALASVSVILALLGR